MLLPLPVLYGKVNISPKKMTKLRILVVLLMLHSILVYGQRNNKTRAKERNNEVINPSFVMEAGSLI